MINRDDLMQQELGLRKLQILAQNQEWENTTIVDGITYRSQSCNCQGISKIRMSAFDVRLPTTPANINDWFDILGGAEFCCGATVPNSASLSLKDFLWRASFETEEIASSRVLLIAINGDCLVAFAEGNAAWVRGSSGEVCLEFGSIDRAALSLIQIIEADAVIDSFFSQDELEQ